MKRKIGIVSVVVCLVLVGAREARGDKQVAARTWAATMSIENAFAKIPEAKYYSWHGYVDKNGNLASSALEDDDGKRKQALNCTSYAGPVLCALRYGDPDWKAEQHKRHKREGGWIDKGAIDPKRKDSSVIEMAGRDMASFFELGNETKLSHDEATSSSKVKDLVAKGKLVAGKWYFFSVETAVGDKWRGHVGFVKANEAGEWTPQHFTKQGLTKNGFSKWLKDNYSGCDLRVWLLPDVEKKEDKPDK